MHEQLLRKIFRRCAILVKLELLYDKSKDNIEFIEANIEDQSKQPEVLLLSRII